MGVNVLVAISVTLLVILLRDLRPHAPATLPLTRRRERKGKKSGIISGTIVVPTRQVQCEYRTISVRR